MSSDPDTSRGVPAAWSCGSYTLGHDMHYIQSRISLEDGPGEPRTIEAITDDGTITFSDGGSVWNHHPARLRAVLRQYGNDVLAGSRGVLRVAHDGGWYCFSVSNEPNPCRPETSGARPGESIIEELRRRGGILRSGAAVLAELTDPDARQ